MSRALIILDSDHQRRKASEWVAKAPPGTRVEFGDEATTPIEGKNE